MKARSWFSVFGLAMLAATPIRAAVARPNPCALLEKAEVETLLGGQVNTQQQGPSCMWSSGEQQLALLNIRIASNSTLNLTPSVFAYDDDRRNYERTLERLSQSSESLLYGNGYYGSVATLPNILPIEMQMNRAYSAKQRSQLPALGVFAYLTSKCESDKCAQASISKENRHLVMQLHTNSRVSDEQLADLKKLAETAITRRAK
ncbi:MAG: hypothetical protein QM808_12175 [Steroidobacteraceae bacterium]